MELWDLIHSGMIVGAHKEKFKSFKELFRLHFSKKLFYVWNLVHGEMFAKEHEEIFK